MKTLLFKRRGLTVIMLSAMMVFLLPGCTHDDKVDVDIKPPTYEYGSSMVNDADGWEFDKTHSNVRWETAYFGSAALLTGRFNEFEAEMTFDEDNPENTSFIGRVVLSTVNTGEPGRDAGCLLNTFGTAESDEAVLTSKSVEFDGQGGYIAKADLNFHGFEHEVEVKLNFTGETYFDEDSGVRNAPLYLVGFSGEFQFNAKTDFGIETSNIADRVTVKINLQFKKYE